MGQRFGMADEQRDEKTYLAARAEQLAARMESEGVSRKKLLQLVGGALPLLAGGKPLAADAPAAERAQGSPIRKPLPPEWFVPFGTNAETRWDALAEVGYEVPNERFFVRNHTATPAIDAATWRLRVFGDGLKLRPGAGDSVEFSLRDLKRLRSRKLAAFIECAGNGRGLFAAQQGTPAPGTQWGLGGVGVAEWRGVPLSEVLERAGITKDAVDVLPQGLDANVVSGGVDLGKVRRPLPVDKALDDVLLAYEMNGVQVASRPRLSRPPRRARVGRDRQHQVARPDRGLDPSALLSLEHDVVPHVRSRLPRRLAAAHEPAGQERAGARPGRRPSARQADDSDGACLVGDDCRPPRGGLDRPRRDLGRGQAPRGEPSRRLGALEVHVRATHPGGLRDLDARDGR